MDKKIEILTETPSGFKRAWFFCPGCESDHAVYIEGDKSKVPVWGYNGSEDKPTFTPSVLVSYPQYSEAKRKERQFFYEENGRYPTAKELPFDKKFICHSFVKDGMIQFLNDCTHNLKGQTVNLRKYTSI